MLWVLVCILMLFRLVVIVAELVRRVLAGLLFVDAAVPSHGMSDRDQIGVEEIEWTYWARLSDRENGLLQYGQR